MRRPSQLVGYVGEESPVEGAWFEEEKSSCSKRAILALLSCSSFKRFSLSSSLFSLSSSPFSLSSDLILSCSVSCSMSYTGRQLNVARKRRQGGKVETHSDLVMGRESAEAGEVVIAVVRGERNQEQQGAGQKGGPTLAIQQPGLRRQSGQR